MCQARRFLQSIMEIYGQGKQRSMESVLSRTIFSCVGADAQPVARPGADSPKTIDNPTLYCRDVEGAVPYGVYFFSANNQERTNTAGWW